jgi:hypothetical protein
MPDSHTATIVRDVAIEERFKLNAGRDDLNVALRPPVKAWRQPLVRRH